MKGPLGVAVLCVLLTLSVADGRVAVIATAGTAQENAIFL